MTAQVLDRPSLARLRTLAEQLLGAPGRHLLGITGAPGAGKSTLAEALASCLGPAAAFVPMDGFHLAGHELRRLGRQDRKGAPDTFDAFGYLALLRRLSDASDPVVYAPEFRREIEEPVSGAIPVSTSVRLVITEGNYLLLDDLPWADIRRLLDTVWFLQPDEAERTRHLIERHVAFGKGPAEAREWVTRSDQANASLIARSAGRADLLIRGWVELQPLRQNNW